MDVDQKRIPRDPSTAGTGGRDIPVAVDGLRGAMIWWTAAAFGKEPAFEDPHVPSARNPAVDAPPPATPVSESADLTGSVGLFVDAKVPVEVRLEGVKLGELYFPGQVRWDVSPGPHALRLYTNGNPTELPLDFVVGREVHVLVGRTGVSTSEQLVAAPAGGPSTIEFRLVGQGSAQIRLDSKPTALGPGEKVSLTVPSGNHPLSVRSGDGTVIWASGNLEVGGGPVVVLIAEGRMPEVSGQGSFHAGGG